MTESEPVSFVWRIYWERPQICYGLTMRILHGIYLGEYKDAEYLPSYGKMSEKYNVSVSTVRRTIHMLNQTGAAVSVNGVGTRIFPAGVRCNLPDFQSLLSCRNLSLFLQSFEIIAYSCEEVVSSTLLSLTREQYSQLVCVIEQHRDSGQHAFTLWHLLICIATHNPLAGDPGNLLQAVRTPSLGLPAEGIPAGSFRIRPYHTAVFRRHIPLPAQS